MASNDFSFRSTGTEQRLIRDSAFTEIRRLPLHRWVPSIAGFSADFVDDCLRKYLPGRKSRQASVLDPIFRCWNYAPAGLPERL